MAESPTREPQLDIEWRRLTPVVWVGRRDGHHVGMIERGWRFVATDGDGVVRGRCRDLASAEALFSGATPSGAPIAQESTSAGRKRRVLPLLPVAGTSVMLGLVGAAAAATFLR